MPTLLPSALCLLLLVPLVQAEWVQAPRRVALLKVAASLCFVAQGLASGALEAGSTGLWTLGALLACFAGDVLLLWRSRGPFLAGILAFLGGHLAYCGALLGLEFGARGAWLAAPLLTLVGALVLFLLWSRVGPLRPAVVAYVVVISAMVSCAAGAAWGGGGAWLLVAALGFYASDLLVARDRFVAQSPLNKALLLPLYYGAQLLFAALLPGAAG